MYVPSQPVPGAVSYGVYALVLLYYSIQSAVQTVERLTFCGCWFCDSDIKHVVGDGGIIILWWYNCYNSADSTRYNIM